MSKWSRSIPGNSVLVSIYFPLSALMLSMKCQCSYVLREPRVLCIPWGSVPAPSPRSKSSRRALWPIFNKPCQGSCSALTSSLMAAPPPPSLLHFTRLSSEASRAFFWGVFPPVLWNLSLLICQMISLVSLLAFCLGAENKFVAEIAWHHIVETPKWARQHFLRASTKLWGNQLYD